MQPGKDIGADLAAVLSAIPEDQIKKRVAAHAALFQPYWGQMFGFIILPITFLGGTCYSWTRLAPVTVGGWHWLQTIVLVKSLIYVNQGMRAAFTEAPHIHLYVVYPVVLAFAVAFLAIGLRNFRRRVIS